MFRTITATPGADTSFLFIPDILLFQVELALFHNISNISWYTLIYHHYYKQSMPQQEGGMNMSTMNIVMWV